MNNLKTKVDDLDVGILKTVCVGLKRLSDLIDNEVVKNKIQHTKDKSKQFKKENYFQVAPLEFTKINTAQIKKNKGRKLKMLTKKYQIQVV